MNSILVVVFLLGLIIGSFLNVVIFRLNTGRSISRGRSKCLSCGKPLAWYELVPVFSYLFLRGKCKSCHAPISPQYPIVEFIAGVSFVVLFWVAISRFGVTQEAFIHFAFLATIASLFIVMIIYDIRHKIIPDQINFTFIALAMVSITWRYFTLPDFSAVNTFLAGPAIALPFFLLWFFSKGRALGFGDVKLMLGMGWLLGLGTATLGVLFAFWLGAVVGILLMVFSKRYSRKSEIPFAPFLIVGAGIAAVWGITLTEFFTLWL